MARPRKNPILETRLRRSSPRTSTYFWFTASRRSFPLWSSGGCFFRKESAEDFLGTIEPGFHRFGFSEAAMRFSNGSMEKSKPRKGRKPTSSEAFRAVTRSHVKKVLDAVRATIPETANREHCGTCGCPRFSSFGPASGFPISSSASLPLSYHAKSRWMTE